MRTLLHIYFPSAVTSRVSTLHLPTSCPAFGTKNFENKVGRAFLLHFVEAYQEQVSNKGKKHGSRTGKQHGSEGRTRHKINSSSSTRSSLLSVRVGECDMIWFDIWLMIYDQGFLIHEFWHMANEYGIWFLNIFDIWYVFCICDIRFNYYFLTHDIKYMTHGIINGLLYNMVLDIIHDLIWYEIRYD